MDKFEFKLKCEYVEERSDAVLIWTYGVDGLVVMFHDKPTKKMLRVANRFLYRTKNAWGVDDSQPTKPQKFVCPGI